MKTIGEYRVRSNVKVVFDNPRSVYPQARLMYKVKWLIFSKWVEVNVCEQVDNYYLQRSVDEMVRILLSNGRRDKHYRKKQRSIERQLRVRNRN